MATVQDLINEVTRVAAGLSDGLDTEIQIGLCDGANMKMFGQADVDFWAEVPTDGSPGGKQFVLVRVHEHPGAAPVDVVRGVAADAEDELRKLTENTDDE